MEEGLLIVNKANLSQRSRDICFLFQYFVVDESSGRLLVQGRDQNEATEIANLLLSNVKPYDDLEVDRNFCFQVIFHNTWNFFFIHIHNAMQYCRVLYWE